MNIDNNSINQKVNSFAVSLTVERVSYDEKYGGDTVYAEIYKGEELIGTVAYNGYLKYVMGTDLRLPSGDKNKCYYPNVNLTINEQVNDAIINTVFLIGMNDSFVDSIRDISKCVCDNVDDM